VIAQRSLTHQIHGRYARLVVRIRIKQRKLVKRSRIAAATAGLITLTSVTVPSAQARVQSAVLATGLSTVVTLITGDRVDVQDGQVKVHQAAGRQHVTFVSRTDGRGHLHVVPSDATRRITSGELDARLFDITLLSQARFDDASTDVMPLIVQTEGEVGIAAERSLRSIGANVVKAPKSGSYWSGVHAAGTRKIWLDAPVKAVLDRSAAQIGAPAAWQAGHTGKGTKVAVLDSGVDATHPDLADAIVDAKDFTSSPSGTDDLVGHGTHVASTITGSGKYQGIAPDAKLLNGKVLGDNGTGPTSVIIAGMEWAVAAGANVVNMSLGSELADQGDDPLSLAVNRLTESSGALFVVAAGNSGDLVGAPAAADAALTVGAVDRDDKLAPFSSRGPRWVNNAIKPDITAPGVNIVAAKAKNGRIGTPVGDGHVALSGTSMAAPHVAGAAAILAGQHSDWRASDLKAALMNSAKPNPALSIYEQGAGRLDVAQAVSRNVTATPASISLGTALWPHNDDQPITSKITYRNSSDQPLTLSLAVEASAPGAKIFAVEPRQLTVPAHGTAGATVTADTRADAPDGVYGGTIAASDGTRTPIGVVKETESFDVKLSFIDRHGAATPDYFFRLVDLSSGTAQVRYDPSGMVTTRVPKGTYYFETQVLTAEGDSAHTSVIVEPNITIDRDMSLVWDAREAKQPAIAVDAADAAAVESALRFEVQSPTNPVGLGVFSKDWKNISVRPSRTTSDKFTWSMASVMAKPDGKGGYDGSPYQYHVEVRNPRSVPEDLQRSVRNGELAEVQTVVAAREPGLSGVRDFGASGPLPLRLKEFYTPGVPWRGYLTEFRKVGEFPSSGNQVLASPRSFQLGKVVEERWNTGVFGPAFPADELGNRYARRLGDDVRFDVQMMSDSAPNRFGATQYDSAKTVLSRDGKILAEDNSAGSLVASLDTPAKATYKLHAESRRGGGSVSADWAFTTEHVEGEVPGQLPLIAVRFAPQLDDHNRADADSVIKVPVYVQHNRGEEVSRPAVQVSYDDGATWRPAPLAPSGSGWNAIVRQPKGTKFVSFKAQAHDTAGNSVDQTMIRAYEVK
jgi:subtilisin family serine protease